MHVTVKYWCILSILTVSFLSYDFIIDIFDNLNKTLLKVFLFIILYMPLIINKKGNDKVYLLMKLFEIQE
jgi:hypothetical protein